MLRRLVAERQIKLGAYQKMKKHIKDYDVFKETISQNNILAMAEQLAMYETRFLIFLKNNVYIKSRPLFLNIVIYFKLYSFLKIISTIHNNLLHSLSQSNCDRRILLY